MLQQCYLCVYEQKNCSDDCFFVGAVTKGEGNIMEKVHAVFADVLFESLSRSTLCTESAYAL